MVNLFVVYKLDTQSRDLNSKFTLRNRLFGDVKLTKNANPDKYGYSGYDIGFDTVSNFSINGEQGKNVGIFGAENSLSLHADNRKKDILVLGEGPADGWRTLNIL